MAIPESLSKCHSSRTPFSNDDLEKIFCFSPIYTENFRPAGGQAEAIYWVPLIALHTGMRLREICQLRTKDIIRDPVSGGWYFDVQEKEQVDDGSGSVISLKNIGSARKVPVHGNLITANLLGYLEWQNQRGEQWLFPGMVPDCYGNRSASFGKFWGRFMRSTLNIRDPNRVLHSFRHGFKDSADTWAVTSAARNQIMGHSEQGTGSVYGAGIHVSKLGEEMAKINFPIMESFKPWQVPSDRRA